MDNNNSAFKSYDGNASLAPLPLSVGSAIIKPEDKGKIKSNAVEAMHYYAEQEMALLRKQADVILQQVREIEERIKISEKIYQADLRYSPVVNQVYYLYETNAQYTLSLIGPTEWGRSKNDLKYLATVKLLGDYSWQIIEKSTS